MNFKNIQEACEAGDKESRRIIAHGGKGYTLPTMRMRAQYSPDETTRAYWSGRVIPYVELADAKKSVKSWLMSYAQDYCQIDPNYTKIAEDCAHDLDKDEWLDDECHFIWEMVMDHFNEC